MRGYIKNKQTPQVARETKIKRGGGQVGAWKAQLVEKKLMTKGFKESSVSLCPKDSFLSPAYSLLQ